MEPSSPVVLDTDAVDITMQPTDSFFFSFEVDGVLSSGNCSSFTPPLPTDYAGAAGTQWPDANDYPNGVAPGGCGTFTYTWTPSDSASQDNLGEGTGSIRVGDGADNGASA